MRIFVTSDIHLHHKNIIRYCNRPFSDIYEMERSLTSNWNSVVSKNDHVYILGDVAFCQPSQAKSFLDNLNGKKFLIRGNHDKTVCKEEVARSFEWIKDYFTLTHSVDGKSHYIVMFHFPIQSWDRKHHGSIHLHGHVHSSENSYKSRSYDVGVDANSYTPVLLDDIIRRLEQVPIKSNNYE